MTFNDLTFVKRDDGMWRSKTLIGNLTLSVIAGQFAYSQPRETLESVDGYSRYEAAVMDDDGHLMTSKIRTRLMDEVIGYMTPEEINELIKEIESYENH